MSMIRALYSWPVADRRHDAVTAPCKYCLEDAVKVPDTYRPPLEEHGWGYGDDLFQCPNGHDDRLPHLRGQEWLATDIVKQVEEVRPEPKYFDGETYDGTTDYPRLNDQTQRVFDAMRDGQWRTLEEIHEITGDPQASISARLRDLRKDRFGKHQVRRQHRGDARNGLFEYRVIVSERALSKPC